MKTKDRNLIAPFLLPINLEDHKLVLPYKNDEGNIRGEIVVATKDGDYYKIKSIPFHASRIALNDVVDIREQEGILYFHKIIESSGHSVIQMIIFNEDEIEIEKDLRQFGCIWRRGSDKRSIAFDVPKHAPYESIKEWLDQGEQQLQWAYRVACLSHA